MEGLGDEIAEVIAEIRSAAPDELMPDIYELIRGTDRIPDGDGGFTEEPVIVETGSCRLVPSNRLAAEALAGDVLTAVASYELHLPIGTTIRATDTVVVNGSAFAVTGPPIMAGAWAIDVTVPVEARQ